MVSYQFPCRRCVIPLEPKWKGWSPELVACFLFLSFFSPCFISFHPLHHPRDHFWTCLLRKSTNMRHGEKHTSFSIIYTCHMHSEWACRYASRISPGRVAAAAGVMGGRLSHVANSTSLLQIFASQPRRNSLEAFLFNKKPSTAAVRFLIRLKEKPWR